MPTNDFKPFGTGSGAGVVSQGDYAASAYLGTGFPAGILQKEKLNKALRQSSSIAAALAQLVANSTGSDVLDDGNFANLLAVMQSGIFKLGGGQAKFINNKLALLGDSIIYNGIGDNDATHIRNTNRSFGHWIPFLTMQRFVSPQSLNFGVSGQTSSQIAARVSAVVASGAGFCLVLAGTNDIGGAFTTTQTQTNLAAIYKALSDAGIFILALPILPRTLSTEADYSFPQKVNEWISRQGQNYPGFRFIDPVVFGNQYSVTYSPRTGYSWDGLHPTAIGAYTIAWHVSEYLNTLLPAPGPAVRSITDYWNSSNRRGVLTPNPLLGGTSGTLSGAGITGQVADSFRVLSVAAGGDVSTLTAACSKNVATFGAQGVNQRIVLGGTATGGFDTAVYFDLPGGIPNISSGDSLELIADVEVTGAAIGISGVCAGITVQQNGTYMYTEDGYSIVSEDYNWQAIPQARFKTPPLALSGTIGGSNAYIKVMFRNTGTTRSVDLRINAFAVRKIVD